jgi:probable rRNA maturation factor
VKNGSQSFEIRSRKRGVSQLEIIAEVRVPVGVRPALRRVMRQLMRLEAVEASVCIVLSNDTKLRALKKEFWGEDAATDVLSFPQWEPGDPFVPEMLGDIVISVETAARQAAEHGHDLTTEIVILSSHGLTHLLGFDHATEQEWEPFRTMERAALEALKA